MKIQSKIIILIAKSDFSGSQKYALDQAIDAKKDGQAVMIVSIDDNYLKDLSEENQIRFISLSNLKKDNNVESNSRVLRQLIKLYRTEKPTELHLHGSRVGFLGSVSGLIYKITSLKKVQIYYTVHKWPFNENLRWFKKFLHKLISYWTILNCEKVFVLSNFEFNQVKNWPWVKNRLKIKKLEIGDLAHEFIPRENARDFFAKNLSLNKNKKWVVTVSEINNNKNLQLGVEAFKKINGSGGENFVWIIIGDGAEKVKIQKTIEEYSLNSHIFMFGSLKNAYKYLKAFDLFLLTSKKEGLPYVLLEAEQAGLDIISTKVGAIQEYFNNKNNILIESKNQSGLEEALIKKLRL